MFTDSPQKVSADHLRRDAYLYVRQSSLRQVIESVVPATVRDPLTTG